MVEGLHESAVAEVFHAVTKGSNARQYEALARAQSFGLAADDGIRADRVEGVVHGEQVAHSVVDDSDGHTFTLRLSAASSDSAALPPLFAASLRPCSTGRNREGARPGPRIQDCARTARLRDSWRSA